MLARELPRERVEVAHALHRDQERLVCGEPGVCQERHLLAQVVLQLRHVDGVDRLAVAEVAPPLADLLLERGFMVRSRDRSGSLAVLGGATEGERAPPDAAQRVVHGLPLAALLGELGPAL